MLGSQEVGAGRIKPVRVTRLGVHGRDGLRGYQLTFRADDDDELSVTTAIVSTFADSGLERLAGTETALVTITTPFLTGEVPMPFPPGQAVLDLPPGAAVTIAPDLLQQSLDAGYGLCAPVLSAAHVGHLPEPVEFVRIDARALGLEGVIAAAHATSRTCVVTGIEDHDALRLAREAGADLLIGPAVSLPEKVTTRPLPASNLAVVRLFRLLGDPDVSVPVVEEIVKSDASLSYRLLRVANSAANSTGSPITTVRSAIMRIGLRQLRSWLMLILVSDATSTAEDQLFAIVTRARACEVLADIFHVPAGEAFVVGLLSAVAPQLGRDRVELAVEMRLDPGIIDVLAGVPGPLTQLLEAVETYDAGRPLVSEPPSAFDVSHAWLDAMGWSLQACRAATEPLDGAD